MFSNHSPTFFKTSLFLWRKQDLLCSTVMLRLGKQQLYLFFKLNVVKFQIPSSLSNMGSEQLGLCPLPELALHLHPNYAQPKVFPEPSCFPVQEAKSPECHLLTIVVPGQILVSRSSNPKWAFPEQDVLSKSQLYHYPSKPSRSPGYSEYQFTRRITYVSYLLHLDTGHPHGKWMT